MAVDDEFADLRRKRAQELQTRAATSGPVALNGETFGPFLENHRLAMVDVWAAWCGPCRMMEPVVEELAAEWGGRAAVGKLDADENYEVLTRYGIRGIPTFLFFKDGALAGRLVGARPKRDFQDVLARLESASAGPDESIH